MALLLLGLLMNLSFCQGVDPFDIFSANRGEDDSSVTNNLDFMLPHSPVSSDSATFVTPLRSQPDEISALEHYRELHRVLVRILWNPFQTAFNEIDYAGPQKFRFVVNLLPADIKQLRVYCSLNRTLANSVSSDSINAIFSHIMESVELVPRSSFSLTSFVTEHIFLISTVSFSLVLLLISLYIGLRRLLLILVPGLLLTLILVQTFLRKYHEQLASKLSTLSRYDGLPDHCRPTHLQSWSTRLFQMISLRPNHDDCAHYYQRTLMTPWIMTDVMETLGDIFTTPIICVFRALGKGIGVFYDSLSVYMPSFMAAILLPVYFLLILIVAWWLPQFLFTNRSARKKCRKRIRCNSLPAITN